MKLIRQEHVLRFLPYPAVGYRLNIPGRRYMIDDKGVVNTPTLPAVTKNLELFVQAGDVRPYAVLPSVEFVPADRKPKPTVLKLIQKLPASMNPGSEGAMLHEHLRRLEEWEAKLKSLECTNVSSHEACLRPAAIQSSGNPIFGLIPDRCRQRPPCAPGANDKPCCVDYNGPVGDGKPINRNNGNDCFAIGYKFFEWSTCFIWTVAGPCANESAYPWNNQDLQNPAPDCWSNHKYRNCQNLDPNDFHLGPPSRCGQLGPSDGSRTAEQYGRKLKLPDYRE
jgi:hypothetical protein